MNTANFLIVLGTALIAVGGLIATYGWSIRSTADTRAMLEERSEVDRAQRRADLLKTLAAEFTVNARILDSPPIAEPDAAQLARFTVFPRLQTTATASAIASGIFTRPEGRPLFTALVAIQELMADFNNRLQTTETHMLRGEIASWRTKLRDGATRQSLRGQLNSFGALLIRNGVDRDYAPFADKPTGDAPKSK